MSYEKLLDATISTESAKAWRESGKKAVGTVCCHVPHEIIYAAGILPVRLRATGCVDSSGAEAWMSSFSCSYARSILQYLMDGKYELDGLIQSDGCMMPTRIFDNWEHVSKKNGKDQFCHQIGAPRITTDITVKYYTEELKLLADSLGKLSGTPVTDASLKAAAEKYNEIRTLIAQLNELRKADKPVISGSEALAIMIKFGDCTPDEYIALLKEFLAEAKTRKPIEGRARLMLIGSALDNPEYIKVIEDKGGIVVAEDNCFGERNFGEQLVVDDKDVLGSIAKYYLTRNTCPRSLDNRPAIHKEILEKAKAYGVKGVIYQKMQNCECWGGEAYYLEPALKDAGIPMLQVEREEQMANAGQLAIRAEAFIEMLDK
jgi:benzoyl-CoA reductase/2-hydroxyglutaryl-CoA dehydratase subunit BcrC/BadD/HgdB